jgi:hypothetical protein
VEVERGEGGERVRVRVGEDGEIMAHMHMQ